MPIGPKGPPRKPGLSIRGRVIQSTFRGVPYTRPWPPSRPTKPGSPRNLTAKAFGAANRACKVTAAAFYGEHWAATRGTPLLPRDLMIAMMYGRAFALYLEDGRIIRSMASRNDVSSSLDMISHTPGQTLVRGEKYWEGRQQTTGNHKAMMTVKADRTGQNYDAGAVISFDEATYDQGGWTNFPTVKDRFTVPEGTNYVQCTGQVGVRALAAGVPVLLQLVKNGVGAFPGRIIGRENINTTTRFATFTSPPVPCVPGDEFTLYLQTNGDTSITLLADWTYLSILTV